MYHPNSCPQILPTPHPSPVSVSVDFLAVASLGISENVQKISLFKDDRLEFALTSEEIFLDWKPHTHPLFGDNIFAYSRNEKVEPEKQSIMLFSIYIYVCVQLFIVFSYLSISFLLICYVSHLALKLYSWKSLYDSLF